MFKFTGSELVHFSSMEDMTIYNQHGRNAVLIENLADFLMRNVYINHSALNCVYIEGSSFDMWHLLFVNSWFENATNAGIRIDPADHDITKLHILDSHFYADDLGVIFQRAVESGGTVRSAIIRGNHVLNTGKTGIQLWKNCDHILIDGNTLRGCGQDSVNTQNGIRVGDGDVSGDKCQWLKIVGNIIDGQSVTKWGISLEDFSDRILVTDNIIHGCATAPYNAEGGVTNVEKAHNIEV